MVKKKKRSKKESYDEELARLAEEADMASAQVGIDYLEGEIKCQRKRKQLRK